MLFKIMDYTGHSTEELATANKVDLDKAMARFDELTRSRSKGGHGLTAAAKLPGVADKQVVKEFYPEATEYLFIPPLKGG